MTYKDSTLLIIIRQFFGETEIKAIIDRSYIRQVA